MRHRKTNLKGMICALLSGAMILASVAPASAATARATTMKLEKTEGTVTLKTQNGSARKISNGMRLYNGNTLSTAKYSYAYVNLDDTKAVKLDQSSSATLRQSGNQLELLVKNGKLFFNVSKKLDSKESMNVRTSTMVTGVRGTCGVVEYVDQNKSKLYLIEGRVTLGSGENATVVEGGQTATVVLQPKQEAGGSEQPGGEDKPGATEKPGETDKKMEQKVMVEKLTEKTIPPVALQEIVANPVLQEKIKQTTELKIEKIEEALKQFEKEEAERIEQEKADQEKDKDKDKDKDKEEEKKPEEQKPAADSSSSSSTSNGDESYTPPTQSEPKEFSLEGTVTPGAITAAFAGNDKVHVGLENPTTTIFDMRAGDKLIVPANKELVLWGTQNMPGDATIEVEAQGSFCVPEGAKLSGNGKVHLASGSTLEVHGTFDGIALASDGGATIKNTNTMKLYSEYDISADNYNGESGVLISSKELKPLTDNAWLLMTSHSTSAGETPIKYYYSKSMCEAVVNAIGDSVNGTLNWKFHNDAVIPAGEKGVELADFHAEMGTHAFVVEGTLTIKNNVMITGNGDTVVRLSGGTLIVKDDSSTTADIQTTIENQGSGYVIAHGEDKTGKVEFKNVAITLKAAAESAEIIEGVTVDADRDILLPEYCTSVSGYAPCIKDNILSFEYVSGSYSNGMSIATLNRMLKYNSMIQIYGQAGGSQIVNLSSSDTLTIPKGHSLRVMGTVTGSGIIRVDGGVLVLLEGETRFNADGTSYKAADGVVNVGRIELTEGGELDNGGFVEVSTLSLKGAARIDNQNFIKVGEVIKGTTDVVCQYNGSNGILVVDGDGFGKNILQGASKMALAMKKKENSSDPNDKFEALECIYAGRFNQTVADLLSGNRTIKGEKVVQCNFAQNISITSDIKWDLAGAGVGLAGYSVFVHPEGNLELKNIGSFGGTGYYLIEVGRDATLTVTGDDSITGRKPNLNLAENASSVISAQDGATVSLEDLNLTITVKGWPYCLINGMVTSDGTWTVPACVQPLSGYKCSVTSSDGYSYLSLVRDTGSSEETGSTHTFEKNDFTVLDVNNALNSYEEVTIGTNAVLSLTDGSSIRIPEGKRLIVDGEINGNSSILVSGTTGSQGCLDVRTSGRIVGPQIGLYGGNLENAGVIHATGFTTSGTGNITNQNVIQVESSFIRSGTETYNYSSEDTGVLITQNDCSEFLTMEESNSLFAVATASGSSIGVMQYYFAKGLNSVMADCISNIKNNGDESFSQGVASWEFKKNLEIDGRPITVNFNGADVDLGTNQIYIATSSSITLKDIDILTSANESATVYLNDSSTLTVKGENITESKIKNTAEKGYAIGVSETGASSGTLVNVPGVKLMLQASKSDLGAIVSGAEIKETTGGSYVDLPFGISGGGTSGCTCDYSDGIVSIWPLNLEDTASDPAE